MDFNTAMNDETARLVGRLTLQAQGLSIQLEMVGGQMADLQAKYAEALAEFATFKPPPVEEAAADEAKK